MPGMVSLTSLPQKIIRRWLFFKEITPHLAALGKPGMREEGKKHHERP